MSSRTIARKLTHRHLQLGHLPVDPKAAKILENSGLNNLQSQATAYFDCLALFGNGDVTFYVTFWPGQRIVRVQQKGITVQESMF